MKEQRIGRWRRNSYARRVEPPNVYEDTIETNAEDETLTTTLVPKFMAETRTKTERGE